jgi:non-ribosomal peptide synthetase component F
LHGTAQVLEVPPQLRAAGHYDIGRDRSCPPHYFLGSTGTEALWERLEPFTLRVSTGHRNRVVRTPARPRAGEDNAAYSGHSTYALFEAVVPQRGPAACLPHTAGREQKYINRCHAIPDPVAQDCSPPSRGLGRSVDIQYRILARRRAVPAFRYVTRRAALCIVDASTPEDLGHAASLEVGTVMPTGSAWSAAVMRPLTLKEEALWTLQQLAGYSPLANESLCVAAPSIDGAILQRAVGTLLRRHPILRTIFPSGEDGARAAVLPPDEPLVDVAELRVAAQEVNDRLAAFAERPFDITREPPVRVGRFVTPGRHVVCLAFHHIAYDAGSAGIVAGELIAVYNALATGRSVPVELAGVLQPTAARTARQVSLDYWRRHLAGCDPHRQRMAFGQPDPQSPTFAGDVLVRELSTDARAALREMRRTLRCTENMVLLAGYYLLLALHDGGPDLVVGTRIDGRSESERRQVGFFANTLALRVQVDLSRTFRDLARVVRSTFLAGLEHGDISHEVVLPDVVPDADSHWRVRLFRHVFNYRPVPVPLDALLAGGTVEIFELPPRHSRYDLELIVETFRDVVSLRAVYSTEIHDSRMVDRMLQRYERLLIEMPRYLDQPLRDMPWWICDDEEIARPAVCGKRPATTGEHCSVSVAVLDMTARTAGQAAVLEGEWTCSYAEVLALAAANRDVVRAAGVRAGETVGVAGRRGARLVAAVLGIWIAGAVYMPVVPPRGDYSPELGRLALVLAEEPELFDRVANAVPLAEHPSNHDSDCLTALALADLSCYSARCGPAIRAMVADGPTTQVILDHQGLFAQADQVREMMGVRPGESVIWWHSPPTPTSLLELTLALASGASLVALPDSTSQGPEPVLAALRAHSPGVLVGTHALWRQLLDARADLTGWRLLSVGEPLPAALVADLRKSADRVYLGYRPSGSLALACAGEAASMPGSDRALGPPVPGVCVEVIGEHGLPLPPGLTGHLRVNGTTVPGDLGCWHPGGWLELRGGGSGGSAGSGPAVHTSRAEEVLRRHPALLRAAVVPVPAQGGPDIVAFGEPIAGQQPEVDEVGAFARALLPRAAVPSRIVLLAPFPETVDGRIDRAALVVQASQEPVTRHVPDQPACGRAAPALLDILVTLWREALDDSGLGPDDHFFLNGGTSMSALRMLVKLEEATGVAEDLKSLFEAPTPRMLAELVAGNGTLTAAGGRKA